MQTSPPATHVIIAEYPSAEEAADMARMGCDCRRFCHATGPCPYGVEFRATDEMYRKSREDRVFMEPLGRALVAAASGPLHGGAPGAVVQGTPHWGECIYDEDEDRREICGCGSGGCGIDIADSACRELAALGDALVAMAGLTPRRGFTTRQLADSWAIPHRNLWLLRPGHHAREYTLWRCWPRGVAGAQRWLRRGARWGLDAELVEGICGIAAADDTYHHDDANGWRTLDSAFARLRERKAARAQRGAA